MQDTDQQPQNSRSNSFIRDNASYNEANVIQIRLDTNAVLEKIQVFLSGELAVFETDDVGRISRKIVQKSKPKCNEDGLQGILGFVTSIVNAQVVQGNYDREQYRQHIFFIRNELTKMILINLYTWEIDEKQAESIVDFLLNMLEPFLSRLIDNKERESYASSLQVKENSSYDAPRRGIFGGLFGTGR